MATAGADALDGLTPEQRVWAEHSERLWQRAHAVAAADPTVDPGDVYHALRCLELTPAERLRRDWDVDDFALTPAERALFAALHGRGIKFLRVRVLPLDRVIASKRATGRPKDAASLPALEATLRTRGQ